jgi:signal transduction histidine kinase
VLLDNAIRHGGGAVTVTVEPLGSSVIVEVADQGAGFSGQAEPGTGMQLARGIVERAGGALLVRRRAPHARVALLLPSSPPADGPEQGPPDQPSSKR